MKNPSLVPSIVLKSTNRSELEQLKHIASFRKITGVIIMATTNLRLDDELVNEAKVIAQVMSRSTSKQVEHWAKIGKILEENPDLSYEFVKEALVSKAQADTGLVEEYQFG
jgi:hypothetical protein